MSTTTEQPEILLSGLLPDVFPPIVVFLSSTTTATVLILFTTLITSILTTCIQRNTVVIADGKPALPVPIDPARKSKSKRKNATPRSLVGGPSPKTSKDRSRKTGKGSDVSKQRSSLDRESQRKETGQRKSIRDSDGCQTPIYGHAVVMGVGEPAECAGQQQTPPSDDYHTARCLSQQQQTSENYQSTKCPSPYRTRSDSCRTPKYGRPNSSDDENNDGDTFRPKQSRLPKEFSLLRGLGGRQRQQQQRQRQQQRLQQQNQDQPLQQPDPDAPKLFRFNVQPNADGEEVNDGAEKWNILACSILAKPAAEKNSGSLKNHQSRSKPSMQMDNTASMNMTDRPAYSVAQTMSPKAARGGQSVKMDETQPEEPYNTIPMNHTNPKHKSQNVSSTYMMDHPDQAAARKAYEVRSSKNMINHPDPVANARQPRQSNSRPSDGGKPVASVYMQGNAALTSNRGGRSGNAAPGTAQPRQANSLPDDGVNPVTSVYMIDPPGGIGHPGNAGPQGTQPIQSNSPPDDRVNPVTSVYMTDLPGGIGQPGNAGPQGTQPRQSNLPPDDGVNPVTSVYMTDPPGGIGQPGNAGPPGTQPRQSHSLPDEGANPVTSVYMIDQPGGNCQPGNTEPPGTQPMIGTARPFDQQNGPQGSYPRQSPGQGNQDSGIRPPESAADQQPDGLSVSNLPGNRIKFRGPFDGSTKIHQFLMTNVDRYGRAIGWVLQTRDPSRLSATPPNGILGSQQSIPIVVKCAPFNFNQNDESTGAGKKKDEISIFWGAAPSGIRIGKAEFDPAWITDGVLKKRKNVRIEYFP